MSDVVLRSAYRAFLADPSLEAAEEIVRLQERHGLRVPVCVEAKRVKNHHSVHALPTVRIKLRHVADVRRLAFRTTRGVEVARAPLGFVTCWYDQTTHVPFFIERDLADRNFCTALYRSGRILNGKYHPTRGLADVHRASRRLRALARATSSPTPS